MSSRKYRRTTKYFERAHIFWIAWVLVNEWTVILTASIVVSMDFYILKTGTYPTSSFMESEIAMLRQMDCVQKPGPSARRIEMESNICRIRRRIRLRPWCASVEEISTADKNGVSAHIDSKRMCRSADSLQSHGIISSAQYMAEWPHMHWKRLSSRRD